MRAEATVVQTMGREGRSEAASAAAGAAGESPVSRPQQWNLVIFLTEIFYLKRKKLRNVIKLKSKKNENLNT
jgi:hypothetical protein